MYYRISLIVVSCWLLLCVPSAWATKTLTFDRYEINVPFTVNLPVIATDVINNDQYPMHELVVIGEDDAKKTWLAVYVYQQKDDDFILLAKLPLPERYFAYDVSESQQGLYFLSKNTVVKLGYHNETDHLQLQPVQTVQSIFLIPKASFLSRKNFIQDVNEDGLDDIILADFEKTNLWLARKSKPSYYYQSLPILTQTELMNNSINFKPISLFLADYNLDGRQDIAWISQGQINYFAQTLAGDFTAAEQTIALSTDIYALNWWQMRESDGQGLDQSDLVHRVVEQVKDINGDGLVDVVVRFTKSSGVLDRTNDYEFYFGVRNEAGKLTFPEQANTVIEAEGTLTGLKIIDVNNDNKFEVLLSSFELSVSNIIGALLAGGIDQNVLLFALNEQDSFEDEVLSKEVELNFSLTSGKSGQPIVLLADINGDKQQDLLLSSSENRLSIYLGQTGEKLFTRKASKYKLQLPKNGGLFNQLDINHDDKADFIISYGRLDDAKLANKVTVVLMK